MNIILEQTEQELTSFNIFDLGIVDGVSELPISEIKDETLRKYHLEAHAEFVNLYNVRLVTRNAYLTNVIALFEKNEVCPPAVGDQVLVGYMGVNKFPFILKSVTFDFEGARRSQRIPFPVSYDEKYITSNRANFIHLRKDGAIVIRGSDVYGDLGFSHVYFILGGDQGSSIITNKRILFSLGIDQLGVILSADEDGNVFLNGSNKLYKMSLEALESIVKTYHLHVGTETNNDETRSGLIVIECDKEGVVYVGEKMEVIVGDVSSSDNRKNGEVSVVVAKKVNFRVGNNTGITIEEVDGKAVIDIVSNGCEIKVDDNARKISIDRGGDGKIFIDETGVKIGSDDAVQPIPLGYKLLNWLSTHTHTAPNGVTSPPMQPATPNALLSTKHKVKD